MRNHSYENDFDLHENETACRTHFHKKGFALTLVLKQRHNRTRKWPIDRLRRKVIALNVPSKQILTRNAGYGCCITLTCFSYKNLFNKNTEAEINQKQRVHCGKLENRELFSYYMIHIISSSLYLFQNNFHII